jgi:hypothetical protein
MNVGFARCRITGNAACIPGHALALAGLNRKHSLISFAVSQAVIPANTSHFRK